MALSMDGTELARWTRFAAKGGIGKCTAVQDCIAENDEDLMFLKDDEITVLMQLSGKNDYYLGYCEGVVGHFNGAHVRFHSKLKRPVMTKRSSVAASVSSLSAISGGGTSSPLPSPSPHTSLSAFTLVVPPPPGTPPLIEGGGSRPGSSHSRNNHGMASNSPAGTMASGSFTAASAAVVASSVRPLRRSSTSSVSGKLGMEPLAHSRDTRTHVKSLSGSSGRSALLSGAPSSSNAKVALVSNGIQPPPSESGTTIASGSSSSILASASSFPFSPSVSTSSSMATSISAASSSSTAHDFAPNASRESLLQHEQHTPVKSKDKDRAKRRTGIIGGALPPLPPNFAASTSSPVISRRSLSRERGEDKVSASSPAVHDLPIPTRPSVESMRSGKGDEVWWGAKRKGSMEQSEARSEIVEVGNRSREGESRESEAETAVMSPEPMIPQPEPTPSTSTPPTTTSANDQMAEPTNLHLPHTTAQNVTPGPRHLDPALDDAISERSSLYSTNTHETESVVTHDSLFYFDNPARLSPQRKTTADSSGTLSETRRDAFSSGGSGGAGLDIGMTMLMGDADDDSDSDSDAGFGFTSIATKAAFIHGESRTSGMQTPDRSGSGPGSAFTSPSTTVAHEHRTHSLSGAVTQTPNGAGTLDNATLVANALKHESVSSYYPDSSASVSLYENDGDSEEGEANTTVEVDEAISREPGVQPNGVTEAEIRKNWLDGADSDAIDDDEGEWDGAADIYEDYRYSRYSMASKMSRFSVSTLSKFSAGNSSLDGIPPPIPRGSVDSVQSRGSPRSPLSPSFANVMPLNINKEPKSGLARSITSDGGNMSSPTSIDAPSSKPGVSQTSMVVPTTVVEPSVAIVDETPSSSTPAITSLRPNPSDHRSRPSPLDVSNAASPLLVTSFSSPTTSYSPGISPLLSPALSISSHSSRSPIVGGAASALRLKFEREHGPISSPCPSPGLAPSTGEAREQMSDGRGRGIVVEDDEVPSVLPPSDVASSLASTSPENSPIRAEYLVGAPDVSGLSQATTGSDGTLHSNKKSITIEEGCGLDNLAPSAHAVKTPLLGEAIRSPTGSPAVTELPSRSPFSPDDSQLLQSTRPLGVSNKTSQPQLQNSPRLAPPNGDGQIFRPHPNAPAPNPLVVSGQRTSTYGLPPTHMLDQPQEQQIVIPENNSLFDMMRLASAPRAGPNGVRLQTLFGKTVTDLTMATGPVPIVWSLEPFPPPTKAVGPGPAKGVIKRAATTAVSVNTSVAEGSPAMQNSPIMRDPSETASIRSSQGSVIPRANFFPQVGAPRPRSRSFSGFSSAMEGPGGNDRVSEDSSKTIRDSFNPRASTSSAGSQQILSPQRQASTPSPVSGARPSHSPSPLSLPQNNIVVPTRPPSGTKPPPSPLSRPPLSPPPPPESQTTSTPNGKEKSPRKFGLRQVASSIALKTSRSDSPAVTATPPTPLPVPVRRNSGPAESPANTNNSVPSRISRTISATSTKHTRTVSGQSGASTRISTSQDTDASETRSTMVSPSPITQSPSSYSPMQRTNSLRSKLSLSALRIRTDSRSREEMVASPSTTSTSHFDENGYQKETVHIKDIDFELIPPSNMHRRSSERTSYESSTRDGRPSTQHDSRSDSPAMLSSSVSAVSRSPIPYTINEMLAESPKTAKPTEDAASVEAHRARELKWIQAMSNVPASQARKSKKIRKLVLEGVPSSVRYLVWAHLMDSKAKRTDGVYGQLSKRGKVAATDAIERDAQNCFPEHPHLREPKGPLVTLLQTYFTMVPDIEYQTSLAILAGHLLLFSPEEDAFWTFLSMMDTHLRPYFTPKAVQMEVDAQLFAKAVEHMNSPLAKKLFTDLEITPIDLCRMWFSSAFATVLPPEYVNRMWDVYLCDGPPFFFRVGLAVLSCTHHIIGSFQFRSQAVSFLSRPPPSLLPPDPDAFVSLSLSIKFKDDDIRKQRVKMETQMKREQQATQNHQSLHQRNGPAPTISLPR